MCSVCVCVCVCVCVVCVCVCVFVVYKHVLMYVMVVTWSCGTHMEHTVQVSSSVCVAPLSMIIGVYSVMNLINFNPPPPFPIS